MNMETVSEERLGYLLRQTTHMRLAGVNRRELAEIALEALVTRIELERISKEKLSKEQKEVMKRNLERLSEIEKSIVSLYFMARLKGEKWTNSAIFGSFMKRYPYEGRSRIE